MSRKTLTSALIALTLLAAPLVAHAGAPEGNRPPAQAAGQNASPGTRARLDPAVAQKVRSVRQQFQAEHQAIRTELRASQQKLRELLRANSNDDAAYRQATDALVRARQRAQALRERERVELQKSLTPREMAQVMVAKKDGPGRGARQPRVGQGRNPNR